MKNQGWFVSPAIAWALVVSLFGQTVQAAQAVPDAAALSAFQDSITSFIRLGTFETALESQGHHFSPQDRAYLIDTLGKQVKSPLPQMSVHGDTWVIQTSGQQHVVKLRDPKNDRFEYNGVVFHYDGKKSLKANRETLEKAWSSSRVHSAYDFSLISSAHANLIWGALGIVAVALGIKFYLDHKDEYAAMKKALQECNDNKAAIKKGTIVYRNASETLVAADKISATKGSVADLAKELGKCMRENVQLQQLRSYSSGSTSQSASASVNDAPEASSGDAR